MDNKRYDDLKYWQHQLGLDDWYIVLRLDSNEVPEFAQGLVRYSLEHLSAIIFIAPEESYPDTVILKYDGEVVLVHELLHIKFGYVERYLKKVAYDVHHTNIETLARAYVASRRGVDVNFQRKE